MPAPRLWPVTKRFVFLGNRGGAKTSASLAGSAIVRMTSMIRVYGMMRMSDEVGGKSEV
jgi:hypothetical protein